MTTAPCPLGSPNCAQKKQIDWTRTLRIRTLAEIPSEFPVVTEPIFTYQKIAEEAWKLYRFGMSYRQIGRVLGLLGKVAMTPPQNL